MTIEVLNDKKQWDAFVEASPQGMLFHRWDFLKIVERHSGQRFVPYGIYSGDELMCVFPFFLGKDHGLTVMYSPPQHAQIPYLGPVFAPGVQARRASTKLTIFGQVADELCGEVDKLAPHFVAFTTVPNLLDVRSFLWKKYREHFRMTYTIDLERSLDEIWTSFSKSCRRGIKQVSKYSPEIQQTSDVRPLLEMWRAMFAKRGTQVPLLSDSYLKELVAAFPQAMTLDHLTINGELATAILWCVVNEDRYHWWIGGVNLCKNLSATDYLIWEVAQRAKAAGFTKLDLGEGAGYLSPYKAKFDPAFEPFWTLTKADTLYNVGLRIKRILR